jgi:outer membrane lipoprotein SlyB
MAAPFMWPAAAGFAAPKLLDALHKDSTENLGHNLSLGLIRNEKSARMVGSTATGFAAGAATGAAIGAVGGPIGALVGGVVGAVAGFFSSLF